MRYSVCTDELFFSPSYLEQSPINVVIETNVALGLKTQTEKRGCYIQNPEQDDIVLTSS